MRPNRKWDREHRIATMWLAGRKSDAIAMECGVSRGVIDRVVRRIGLPRRVTGARPVNVWPLVIAWGAAGHSPEAIADGLGLTGRARQMMCEERR